MKFLNILTAAALALCVAAPAQAQQHRGGQRQNQSPEEMKAQAEAYQKKMAEERQAYYADADTALYGVRYRFKYLYNKAENLRYEEDRVALISPKTTLEMSWEGIGEQRWRQAHDGKRSNDPGLAYHLTPSYRFYYPEENRLLQTYRVLADEFVVSDTLPALDWKLEEGERKFDQYTAKKATLDRGGRHWTAWYSEELTGRAAPADFIGLPGVLLELEDSTGEVSWKFNGFVFNTPDSKLYIKEPAALRRVPADHLRKIRRIFARSSDNYLQSSGVYDKDKASYPEKYRPSTGIDALTSDNPLLT